MQKLAISPPLYQPGTGNCFPPDLIKINFSFPPPTTSHALTHYTPTHYLPHTRATPARRPRPDPFSSPSQKNSFSRLPPPNPPYVAKGLWSYLCHAFNLGRNPASDPQIALIMHQMVLFSTLKPFDHLISPNGAWKRTTNGFRSLSTPVADVSRPFSQK